MSSQPLKDWLSGVVALSILAAFSYSVMYLPVNRTFSLIIMIVMFSAIGAMSTIYIRQDSAPRHNILQHIRYIAFFSATVMAIAAVYLQLQ